MINTELIPTLVLKQKFASMKNSKKPLDIMENGKCCFENSKSPVALFIIKFNKLSKSKFEKIFIKSNS